jgi:hypothetical protein
VLEFRTMCGLIDTGHVPQNLDVPLSLRYMTHWSGRVRGVDLGWLESSVDE